MNSGDGVEALSGLSEYPDGYREIYRCHEGREIKNCGEKHWTIAGKAF